MPTPGRRASGADCVPPGRPPGRPDSHRREGRHHAAQGNEVDDSTAGGAGHRGGRGRRRAPAHRLRRCQGGLLRGSTRHLALRPPRPLRQRHPRPVPPALPHPQAASSAAAACAAAPPSATTGPAKACGTLNLADNPWVGYEADVAVVAYIAKNTLHCTVNIKHIVETVSWAGLPDRPGRRHPGELGPRRPQGQVHHRSKVATELGPDGLQGVIGWFVPPWMATEVPRHHRLEEPQQVRLAVQDLRVRRQGRAARRRPVLRHQRRGAGQEPEPRTTRWSRAARRPR